MKIRLAFWNAETYANRVDALKDGAVRYYVLDGTARAVEVTNLIQAVRLGAEIMQHKAIIEHDMDVLED